ncbi:MAG: aminoacyl-tRNA deacylase [Bradyrhizobium sp.]
MSIQVAILKILASHGNGRATLASLKRDIIVLTASGNDWGARLKRLAARVQAIDIFGSGYVLRDDEGWEITARGRDFLYALEAITQDNRAQDNRTTEIEPSVAPDSEAAERPPGALIVVGHRFRNRPRRRKGKALTGPIAFPDDATAREESVSKHK